MLLYKSLYTKTQFTVEFDANRSRVITLTSHPVLYCIVQLCPRLDASGRLLRHHGVRHGPLRHRQHRRRHAARTHLHVDRRQG